MNAAEHLNMSSFKETHGFAVISFALFLISQIFTDRGTLRNPEEPWGTLGKPGEPRNLLEADTIRTPHGAKIVPNGTQK